MYLSLYLCVVNSYGIFIRKIISYVKLTLLFDLRVKLRSKVLQNHEDGGTSPCNEKAVRIFMAKATLSIFSPAQCLIDY